jgi:hypothetical protein
MGEVFNGLCAVKRPFEALAVRQAARVTLYCSLELGGRINQSRRYGRFCRPDDLLKTEIGEPVASTWAVRMPVYGSAAVLAPAASTPSTAMQGFFERSCGNPEARRRGWHRHIP